MCFRLDEGHGRCQYFIGVEDDGRHSLLSYSSVAQSAMILECIARSLNAVVLERLMIQGEVTDANSLDFDAIRKYETPVFYREFHPTIQYRIDDTDIDSLSDSELDPQLTPISDSSHSLSNSNSDGDLNEANFKPSIQSTSCLPSKHAHTFHTFCAKDTPRRRALETVDGVATRCELTIQRVETHLLDTSPVSIVDLAQRKHKEIHYRERLLSNVSDGICAATEAFALLSTSHSTDQHHESNNHSSQHNESNESSNSNHQNIHTNLSDLNSGLGHHPNSSSSSNAPNDDSSDDDSVSSFSPHGLSNICETLSSRNIRVAVVGNVVRLPFVSSSLDTLQGCCV